MSVWAVVVAAGRGSRAGLGMNKVFYPMGGRTVLEICLRAVRGSGVFDGVAVVLSREDVPRFERLGLASLADRVALGGDTRQASVYGGLKALPEGVEIVAVHDAARPFAAPELFRQAVDSARAYGSGVVCTLVTDTIKQIDAQTGRVSTPPRDMLRAVQTPQAFKNEMLLRAHERARAAGETSTDDAALFERTYGTVHLVTPPMAEKNRKLTTAADFAPPRARMPRVGTGWDAHRLAAGRALVLGGVEIPHEMGLDGHSDADAPLHALMDAMLGAAALGDIGRHFPDSDPAYLGISSLELLRQTARLIGEAGWRVGNADVTIVAQRPRLAPHVPLMRARIAEALGVGEDRVSVKATTSERMGFEGTEEGISAQAVVLLEAMGEEWA